MRLSRFIRTGTGLFFMNAGTELTPERINLLNRMQKIDPFSEKVFVWEPKE